MAKRTTTDVEAYNSFTNFTGKYKMIHKQGYRQKQKAWL